MATLVVRFLPGRKCYTSRRIDHMPTKFLALTVFATSMASAVCLLRAASSLGSAPSPYRAVEPAKNPAGPAITAVELDPPKTLLEQPCPVVLVFQGKITASRPTHVTYIWVDSRGRPWPQRHRSLLSGVSVVNHRWKVGHPAKTVDEWVELRIVAPQSLTSNKVPVHFTCQK